MGNAAPPLSCIFAAAQPALAHGQPNALLRPCQGLRHTGATRDDTLYADPLGLVYTGPADHTPQCVFSNHARRLYRPGRPARALPLSRSQSLRPLLRLAEPLHARLEEPEKGARIIPAILYLAGIQVNDRVAGTVFPVQRRFYLFGNGVGLDERQAFIQFQMEIHHRFRTGNART